MVDDAIVVVETVERNIEKGLRPREATHRAMEEMSGTLLSIELVLVTVFVPTAFLGGIASVQEKTATSRLVHYNLYPVSDVRGNTAPGFSSGEAISNHLDSLGNDS